MSIDPLAPSDIPIPPGCNPCRFCNVYCMEVEAVEDWNGRGRVIRIWNDCDEADKVLEWEDVGDVTVREKGKPDWKGPMEMCFNKDDIRTDFAPEAEAVAEWNEMNP